MILRCRYQRSSRPITACCVSSSLEAEMPQATQAIQAPHFEQNIAAEKARPKHCLGRHRGPKKEALLEKIKQLETAAHVSEWLSSLGLHPPTELRAVAGRKTKPRPDGDRS